jgi:hypothetical protein
MLVAALACLASATGVARAATVSSDWAGYVVKGSAARTHFDRVVGAWQQPTATCVRGRQTYSAFWVGLGGYEQSSSKLEQTGTDADCDAAGHGSYYAWYELVPSPPVAIKLAIRPTDTIAASVTVASDTVLLHLRDLTSGHLYSRRLPLSSPDTSSAEWIAEAPSSCTSAGCRTLPLTDFGTVAFDGASATTARGQSGPISDPGWEAIPIEIQGDFEALTATTGPTFAGATPGALSDTGASFAVTWQQTTGPAPPTPPSIDPSPSPPESTPPQSQTQTADAG